MVFDFNFYCVTVKTLYSEDITPSQGYLKGWRICKVTFVILGLKILPRNRVQGS